MLELADRLCILISTDQLLHMTSKDLDQAKATAEAGKVPYLIYLRNWLVLERVKLKMAVAIKNANEEMFYSCRIDSLECTINAVEKMSKAQFKKWLLDNADDLIF